MKYYEKIKSIEGQDFQFIVNNIDGFKLGIATSVGMLEFESEEEFKNFMAEIGSTFFYTYKSLLSKHNSKK